MFDWPASRDHMPCRFGEVYQLARNALAATIGHDGKLNAESGHALLLYDARNPEFQSGGKAELQWQVASAACRVPGLLRRLSWQHLLKASEGALELSYLHEPNIWLFGGIYEVIRRYKETHDGKEYYRYKVELTSQHASMIGRLKVRFERDGRNKARLMEKTLQNLVVHEILHSEYEGEPFCGYENIKLPFYSLEHLVNTSKPDWKSALEHAKGIYMIMDTSNGKKYVGSAYGESGIWSRWSCYIGTGHGHNNELVQLISEKGKDYARENFIFTLLEYCPKNTDVEIIVDRESYWKEVLLSREFGYNKN